MAPLRCPVRPTAAATRFLRQQHPSLSTNSTDRIREDVVATEAGDHLAGGGEGSDHAAGEAKGKKLLVGEIRLDGCPAGWTYEISVNHHQLPPKKVPKWTTRLEVPVGDSITLEVILAQKHVD